MPVMSFKPVSWNRLSTMDILTAYLSNKGCCTHMLTFPRDADISSVDDALVQLDRACSDGLRASLDEELLTDLDVAMAALMANDDTKLPVVDALLNARELGGPIAAWRQIVVRARRKRLVEKTYEAILDRKAQIAYDALVRGLSEAEIEQRQGWALGYVQWLDRAAGLRRPGETAEQNSSRAHPYEFCAPLLMGWGIDARCRGEPISVTVCEVQRMGWRWADAAFLDATAQNPRARMAVTYRLWVHIRENHGDPCSTQR